jgi:hypothetical protein
MALGLHRQATWVNNFYYDDASMILDENYKRKSSYFGVKEALKTIHLSSVGYGSCG